MKIAIVEDEIALANELKAMLFKLNETNVSIFESGEQFLFSYVDETYDLIFLDIQMKTLNGLETAKKIREYDQSVGIVFLTNDPSFVFEGYEVDAIRYWLKPVSIEKLKQLLDSMQITKPYIIWNHNGEVMKLYEDEILYLESDGHYVLCHRMNDVLRMKAVFKEFCQQLSSSFMNCHRSYCVNINHIYAIRKQGCCMDNKDILPISRSMKKTIEEAMMKKCREDLLCNL